VKIGELGAQCGVTAKTIRYYESIGLLEETPRRQRLSKMTRSSLMLMLMLTPQPEDSAHPKAGRVGRPRAAIL